MALGKKLFFTALFFSLLTEGTAITKDAWYNNFAWYFHADLKSWLPQAGLFLTPIEITIVVILLIWAMRGRRDRHFHFERGLLFWPIIALLGVLAYGVLWGATRTGSNFTVAIWEIRSLALCIAAYFLVGLLFTHRRDLDTLTWVLLISIFLLGIEDIFRYFFVLNHYVGDLDYDHEDAVLLAFAILLSIAMILLGSTRRQRLFAFVSIPVDLLAMMVTHRRAGFAAIAAGLVFVGIILFRVDKKIFFRVVPVTLLLSTIYLAAYWNCESGTLCQPARAISSQFNPDPRDAASNLYRDLEKIDITYNIENNVLTGLGFGQPFAFYVGLPNESGWPFWHYTPHNEILWVWLKTGILGFILFWWLIGSGIYRGGRLVQALSAAGDKQGRALLAAGVTLIVMQVAVSYVDLGLTDDRAMLLWGVMFGVIGHLPGILRRSINAEESAQVSTPLATETPEAQVGVLAHALVTPEAGNKHNTPSRTQTFTRWGQKDGSPSWPRSPQAAPTGQRTLSRPRGAATWQSRWAREQARWAEEENNRQP